MQSAGTGVRLHRGDRRQGQHPLQQFGQLLLAAAGEQEIPEGAKALSLVRIGDRIAFAHDLFEQFPFAALPQRDALAHPAIARLIDGGVIDAGVPYLVMDHVDGLPITRHADVRALDTTARLRLIVLLILGFGERNPGLTRILTGHALMFEQDRLQGRINQLFERIEAQLRQVMREKKMREGEGYTLDETLLASQLLAFCEGMLSRFVRSEFKYRPTDDFDARWPLVAAQLQ